LVRCDSCQRDWEFSNREDAEEHIQEHAVYTNHEIENAPEKTDPIESIKSLQEVGQSVGPSDGSPTRVVREVIDEAQETVDFPQGVPEQMVYAILSEKGMAPDAIREIITSLRSQGEIYEPKTGYLRTV
jgi:DNA replicative helicase MCM subunit Mcm2 (Cdc46/Mcm family)